MPTNPLLTTLCDGRFVITRVLGCGSYGTVYEAEDQELGHSLAIKVLHSSHPEALYRFKQEFRALADCVHPNLVRLNELHSDGDRWYFTMEKVEGVDFISYVRPLPSFPINSETTEGMPDVPQFLHATNSDKPSSTEEFIPSPIFELIEPTEPATIELGIQPSGSIQVNVIRLRATLIQLAEALRVLHAKGKLHRDIKPPNILVTPSGVLKVLDFGLLKDMVRVGALRSASNIRVGTPAYMSPEQAAGADVSPACDWYSVGVMMYEALTGTLPFTGSRNQILRAKRHGMPDHPASKGLNLPQELCDLCMALLNPNPHQRAGGDDILRMLRTETGQLSPPVGAEPGSGADAFVGREKHLHQLREAVHQMQKGQCVAVTVSGRSGYGKSSLITLFLAQLGKENTVLTLAGRCFETESVPYKAIDDVIDMLSRFLGRLPGDQLAPLLPRNMSALIRLFPVLSRLMQAAGNLRAPTGVIQDVREMRRHGFAALRELLARLTDRMPLVLFLDDLQWGDVDSAILLWELVRPPDPPPLLLILGYRSEDTHASPFLETFLPLLATSKLVRHEMSVEELTIEESLTLVQALMGNSAHIGSSYVGEIATEASGSPFLIHEMVRHIQSLRPPGTRISSFPMPSRTLHNMVRSRVQALSPEAKQLVETVAVAGQSMGRNLLLRAAGLGPEGHESLGILRASHLIRSLKQGDDELVETYHDRIREIIVADLSLDRRQATHLRLAQVLSTIDGTDPETLLVHNEGAGRLKEAAAYAALAAEQAFRILAFDRAVRLFDYALKQQGGEGVADTELKLKYAESLVNIGQSGDAARVILAVAESTNRPDALELQRRGAELLLLSGHLDEGLTRFRGLMKSVSMSYPVSPSRALLSLLWARARLRLRGLGFRERSGPFSASELMRVDICSSLSLGISWVDVVRGNYFTTQNVLLALRSGEPVRVARALASEACFTATLGSQYQERTAALLRRVEELPSQFQSVYLSGEISLVKGIFLFFNSQFEASEAMCRHAEQIFREQCPGAPFELNLARYYLLFCLLYTGRWRDLSQYLGDLTTTMRKRGDKFAIAILTTRLSYVTQLMQDLPDEARSATRQALEHWTTRGFQLQHLWKLCAECEIDLYEGEGESALARLNQAWPALKRSHLLRHQGSLIEALYVRARCRLAVASKPKIGFSNRQDLLRLSEQDARVIAHQGAPWGEVLSELIRAGIASVRRDVPRTLNLLEAAETKSRRLKMAIHASVASRRRGEILGSPAGDALMAGANTWMEDQEIRRPERVADLLLPGCW